MKRKPKSIGELEMERLRGMKTADVAALADQLNALRPGDKVNHPPHYTAHPSGVECIDVVEHMSFNVGNAIKYLWRADLKGAPLEDLRKSLWYVQREIAKREREKGATP